MWNDVARGARAEDMTPSPLSASTLYRLLHTGNPGDEQFYLRAAGEPADVLELGAGWGRLSWLLARAGHRVVGVELDPHFVEAARLTEPGTSSISGSIEFIAADLRELELGRTFERIFVPYNTLYALGGTEGVRRAFVGARRHLADGGELWFDVYTMDEFHAASLAGEVPDDAEAPELVLETEFEGRLLRVFETTAVDLTEQRLDVDYQAETDGAVRGQGHLTHHYLLTHQIVDCLEAAGLEPAGMWGGFAGQAADEDAEHLVVCAMAR